jgi:hypothetical protein
MAESYITRKGGGGESFNGFDYTNMYVVSSNNTVFKTFPYDQTQGQQEVPFLHYAPVSPNDISKTYFSQNAVLERRTVSLTDTGTPITAMYVYQLRNIGNARQVNNTITRNTPQVFAKFQDGNMYRFAYVTNGVINSNQSYFGYWIRAGNPTDKDYVIGNNNTAILGINTNANVSRNGLNYGFINASDTSKGNMTIRFGDSRGYGMNVSALSDYFNNTYITDNMGTKYSPINYASTFGFFAENSAANGTLLFTGAIFDQTIFGATVNNNSNAVFQNATATNIVDNSASGMIKVFNNMIYTALTNFTIQEVHLSNLVTNRTLNYSGGIASEYIGFTIQNNIIYITGRSSANTWSSNIKRYHLGNFGLIGQNQLPANSPAYPSDIIVGNNIMLVRGSLNVSGYSPPGLVGYWISNNVAASNSYSLFYGTASGGIFTNYPEQEFGYMPVQNSSQSSQTIILGATTNNAQTYGRSFSSPVSTSGTTFGYFNNSFNFLYTNMQNQSSSSAFVLHPNLTDKAFYTNLNYTILLGGRISKFLTDPLNPKFLLVHGRTPAAPTYVNHYYLLTNSFTYLTDVRGNFYEDTYLYGGAFVNQSHYLNFADNYILFAAGSRVKKASFFQNPQSANLSFRLNIVDNY